jgi:hypothetical protein
MLVTVRPDLYRLNLLNQGELNASLVTECNVLPRRARPSTSELPQDGSGLSKI